MDSNRSNELGHDGTHQEFVPVAQLGSQYSMQLQPSFSIEPAATADSNASKLSRHHRRNSTVQEQRAAKLKQQETERMLSLPKVRQLLQAL